MWVEGIFFEKNMNVWGAEKARSRYFEVASFQRMARPKTSQAGAPYD